MIHRSRPIRAGLAVIGLCFAAPLAPDQTAQGQNVDEPPLYDSRFVEANGIRLQYMDFGGSGLPLIFVQDIHNYFEGEELLSVRDLESAFYARFTDDHRVLATVKRGYGESDDPGWGYDVATHSEDLLGLMDALGIHRAVLVGRAPATQDLTWIAEHHPERVAGLVYLGNPVVIRSSQHPEARLFDENYARGACDLQDRGIALVGARTSWRPHFLDDETVRIDVPALRFTHPVHNRRSMDLRRLDRLDAIAAWEPECPGHAQSLEYFRALAADPARRAALREALEASDLSVPIDEGIERAFGSSMRSVVEPDLEGGGPPLHDFFEPHMRSFLEEVEQAPSDTVHVAPPTGETNSDRENVQAAFDAVQPGGTVLFAPGTYLLGVGARLTVPEVTVLGHPEGTILRGCDPDAFAVEYSEVDSVVFGCTGLYVEAERQTIRGFTFEYTWHGIVVGPFPASAEEAAALGESGEPPPAYPAGGQRIEGNTFRATPNGLRVLGVGNELSVVRDNDFIDVFHAIGIYGAPLHFLDNRVTVAEPGGVPFSRHTGSAIIVSPGHTDCAGHVVAGNRIEGYPDPIYVLVRRGETCRGVEIRDNTIHAARVKVPEAWGGYTPTDDDSTMVGAPITLMNRTELALGRSEAEMEGVLEDILVQGNQIAGAEGLGILIQDVSRSRIAGNTIVGVERRDPFPGITWDGFVPRWEHANGSAIWLSPRSEGNEVVGNSFEDIASAAVFLEGDSNRVFLQEVGDVVRDLGADNRVGMAGGDADSVRAWLASGAIRLDTVEPGSGLADLQPLEDVVGDARIVALGEPTHGNREVFQLKHRMIEFLVTEMGFNVFALESPMAETFDLNDYVLTGIGDPAKALAGIRYWTWDTEEMLEVIEWIREYNADPAHARKVTFYGFDVQDPERAARVTLEYLQRVDPVLAETVLPELGIFATPFTLPEYGGLRPIIAREGQTPAVRAVGEVMSTLDSRKDDYIAATSAAEWTLVRQHARLLARYVEASSDDARNWNSVRDRAMAENVQWILEQEDDDAKIILWAHNSHVAVANHSSFGFEALGSHLRRMFGAETVIFGFLFNRGGFRAIDAGVPSEGMRNFTLGSAPEGTVEAMLASAGLELAVVDLRRIPAGGAVAEWFREPRPTRHSGGGYNESDPGRYLLEYDLPEAFDVLVFLDETTPVRPVNEADYDVLWVREQTLPAPVNLDFESGRPGEAPEGWLAWSKHRRLGFEMATTTERPHRGSYSAVVRRAPGQRYGEVAGSLSQRIDATPYRGKKIRLRAAARADLADGGSFAFLRLAIDGWAPENIHDNPTPAFDSLDEFRVTSPEWRIYAIVADVPEDAAVISYGLFLAGDGSAWIDDVSVEVVND